MSDLAGLDEVLRQRVLEAGIPSLSAGVSRGDRILWIGSSGWADRAARREATPHTTYSLASITKPFTGTALSILRERGLVDLDAAIGDYLDAGLTGHGGKAVDATVRRVANHTAGLPLHYHFFYADEDYARPPMTESIRRYGIIVGPPGDYSQYSNFGFGVLDHLVSRVSGTPYEDFLRREVFLPLGMTRSAVGLPEELAAHAATRYAPDGVAYPFYDFDHRGGSAVYASAHDLLRFGMAMVKSRQADQRAILSDSAVDEMHEPTYRDGDAGYGVGWATGVSSGFNTVEHSGGMGGVSTMMQLVPSEGVAAVALCNTTSPLPGSIVKELLARVLTGFEPQQAPVPQESATTPVLPGGLQGSWSGRVVTHSGEAPLDLEIRDSGEIVAQLGRQLRTLATPTNVAGRRVLALMPGRIHTPDAERRHHQVMLDLVLSGDELTGAAIAMAPAPRSFALPSFCALRRTAQPASRHGEES